MQLKRTHLATVGATGLNTTALLPVSRVQPFVVADSKNLLQCLELQPLRSVFKWAVEAKAVQRIELCKLPQNEAPLEQFFVGSGSKLLGFNPDGSEFKTQDLNVAHPVKHFRVEGLNIWAATDFFYSHFVGSRELENKVLQDRINDMVIARVSGDTVTNPVLACQDRVLRVLDQERDKYSVGVPGPATCLSIFHKHAGDLSHTRQMLFGTSNGSLGLVELRRESPVMLWSLSEHTEGLISIKQIDLTGNGLNDIVISREGGKVQVYSADNDQFELKTEVVLGESVNSLVAGTPRAIPEVVATTHSGKVIGLTSESRAQPSAYREEQEAEMEQVQRKLEEEKSKFQASRSNPVSARGAGSYSAGLKKRLISSDFLHVLTVESQIPIVKCS
jgi:Bardet-Biedl syndrome 7 protein